VSARWTDGEDDARIDVVLRRRVVRAVFQPVLRLATNLPAAYHATVRGPLGSPLETYERLVNAAAHRGVARDLDELCFAVILDAAERARLTAPLAIAVHRDTDTLATLPASPHPAPFGVIVELDAPATSAHVATVLAAAVAAREQGWRVALRGVAPSPAGLASIDTIDPDVVKIVVPATDGPACHAFVDAVRERGVALVAEGLDTETDVQRATAMGVAHGHGLRFGRHDLLVRAPVLFDREGVTAVAPAEVPVTALDDVSEPSPAPAQPPR
jgi:EAL domain-containing protein (putative c-di-GMP-specific phosphodiesterase class I)